MWVFLLLLFPPPSSSYLRMKRQPPASPARGRPAPGRGDEPPRLRDLLHKRGRRSRRIPGRQYCSHWQYCSLSAPHSLGNGGGRNGLRDLRVSSLRSSARARGNDRALRLCRRRALLLRRRRAAGAGCQPAHLQRSGGVLRAAACLLMPRPPGPVPRLLPLPPVSLGKCMLSLSCENRTSSTGT